MVRCIAVTKSTYKEERVELDHNFNACGPVALGLWQAARGDSSVWQSKCSPRGQKQKGNRGGRDWGLPQTGHAFNEILPGYSTLNQLPSPSVMPSYQPSSNPLASGGTFQIQTLARGHSETL